MTNPELDQHEDVQPDPTPEVELSAPPEPLATEHPGTQPSETADGIRWGPALPQPEGHVRLTATYSDGLEATTDAPTQEEARSALRAYHTPQGA
jgi:hypothetical protein